MHNITEYHVELGGHNEASSGIRTLAATLPSCRRGERPADSARNGSGPVTRDLQQRDCEGGARTPGETGRHLSRHTAL